MDARFQVDYTLALESRSLFFLLGQIVDGVVRPGMVVTHGPAEGPYFRAAIHAIEFADNVRTRQSWVALGFRFLHSAQLGGWQEMDWPGATLDIPGTPILHPCPCCGFRTLPAEERGSYELCPVCGWEDDGVQFDNPAYRGGANPESLNEARAAFFAAHPHPIRKHDG